jgi:RNA polymerase sigma-70 factor (family 1)
MKYNEDENLQIKMLREGSVKAFDYLYDQYSGKLYNFMMTISGRDTYISEEIVQRVFVKIWETHQQINPDKSFISYIYTIARNMLMNNYQHQMVKFVYQEYVLANKSEADHRTEEDIDCNSLNQQLDLIIDQLPPGRRQIFVLSKKEHLSNKNIATKLNISESTVEKQLSKAIQFVRERIRLHYEGIVMLLFISMLK